MTILFWENECHDFSTYKLLSTLSIANDNNSMRQWNILKCGEFWLLDVSPVEHLMVNEMFIKLRNLVRLFCDFLPT